MNISPSLLESAINEVSQSQTTPKERFAQYLPEYEEVLPFVLSDDLEQLTENEKGILLFYTDILLSAHRQLPEPADVSNLDDLLHLFDQFANRWDELPGSYDDKIDVFAQSCKEQEALILLEDLLSEESLTPEGREIAYLTGYTLLTGLNP